MNFCRCSDVEDDNDGESEDGDYVDNDEEENPLDMDILDAPTKSAKAKTMADVWFEQDIFKQALNEDNNDDEDFELERKLSALKSDGVTVLSKSSKSILKTKREVADDDDDESSESETETKSKKSKRALKDDEFEEVPVDHRMLKTRIFGF